MTTEIKIDKGANGFTRNFVHHQYDKITGQILTVIDAVMLGEQNKATKDLIRNIISQAHERVSDLAYKKLITQEQATDNTFVYELVEVFPLTKEQKETESYFSFSN